jgi:hypothetical protein
VTELRVVPNNVEPLPRWNPRDVSNVARAFADKVEAGDFGIVERCLVTVETDVGLVQLYWGDGISHLEAVGILQLALFDATQKATDSYADRAGE